VSWEAAADNGSPVTGYTVTTYPGGTTTPAGPEARNVDVTGLDAATTYEFTVRATNAAGTGDESVSSAGGRPNGLPGPFAGTVTVTAPPVSTGRATATVALAGLGPDGTQYEVEGPYGAVQWVSAAGGTASTPFFDLDVGTTYAFRVRAAAGPGPWSARSTVTTTGAPYVRGVYALAGDGGVHACRTGLFDRGVPATALVFRAYAWDIHALSDYPPTAPVLGTWTFPPDTVDAWLPGLANGAEYMVDVQVVTDLGPGPRSAMGYVARPHGLPGSPGGVTAVPGDGTATVSWAAAGWNGGFGDYEVVASPGGATLRTSQLSVEFDGLANGTAYTFAVRALDEVGYGPAATSAAVTPYGVPGAPTGVTATPANGKAHVSWAAAAPNGSPVDHYSVTTSPGGATATVPAGTTATDVGGLAEGTPYTFTVTATNAAGDSAPSAPSNEVTLDRTAPVATMHALAPVTLSGSVALSYAGTDSGSGVAGSTVRYRAAPYGGGFGAFHVLGAVTSAPVSRGYTYCFSAAATDFAGNVSPWSADSCTVVPLDDRALPASPSWVRGTGANHYAGTYTATVSQGATLTRTGVIGRRLVLVYATVADGATLGVYLNGVLVKKIATATPSTHYRRVTTMDLGAVKSGTVTVKTLTSGRAYVDGLGVSRV
jgi:titin